MSILYNQAIPKRNCKLNWKIVHICNTDQVIEIKIFTYPLCVCVCVCECMCVCVCECMCVCVCVHVCSVAQSGLTLCDSMDCSPPGSSVHGDSPGKNTVVSCHALLQGSSKPRDRTHVSHITGEFFTIWAIN